jgi:hypothetical protein
VRNSTSGGRRGRRVRFLGLLVALTFGVAGFVVPLTSTPALAIPCDDCDPGGGGGGTGGGGGGGGGWASPVTLRGTFSYIDDGPSATTFQRPIAGATVEIWRYAPGFLGIWTWGLFATTATGADGAVSFSTPIGTSGTVYAMRLFATNDAARVYPQTVLDPGGPYWTEPGEPGAPIQRTAWNPGDVLDFSYAFTDRSRGKYFNIAEVLRWARAYAGARRDPAESDPIPVVAVQPSAPLGTWYNAPADQLELAGTSTYVDLVIIHEYAHFLEDMIGSLFAVPTVHDGCIATIGPANANSAEHAWMEGFADWFAQAVRRATPAAGFVGEFSAGGSTPSVGMLETPFCPPPLPPGVTGDEVENFVAGVLWDTTDPVGTPPGETADTLTGLDTSVFQIMDRELDAATLGGAQPTIARFRTAWATRGLPLTQLNQIMTMNGVPF